MSSVSGQVGVVPSRLSCEWHSQPSHLACVGSTLHALKALRNPRWEDYNYEQADDVPNRMYWLGDGQTWNEKTMTGDRAYFTFYQSWNSPPDGCYRSMVFDTGIRGPACG